MMSCRAYARFMQADHILTFFTADEGRIVLEVPENDVESAMAINEQVNFVHLAYYPNTQVFCSAQRWAEGRQAIGSDLLGRLGEQYDFNLWAAGKAACRAAPVSCRHRR